MNVEGCNQYFWNETEFWKQRALQIVKLFWASFVSVLHIIYIYSFTRLQGKAFFSLWVMVKKKKIKSQREHLLIEQAPKSDKLEN